MAPLGVLAGVMLPQAAPVQPLPVKLQVTPPSAASLVTAAVNCCALLTSTLAETGETETDIAGETILMLAEAVFPSSVTEVAVSVTVAGIGATLGAV